MKSLVVHEILERTVKVFPYREIVSGETRLNYEKFYERVARLAVSLKSWHKKGTVVGVLDINTHRYLELHYALSMVGATIHTLNFRLPGEDLVYTMIHVGDEWVFVSELFLPSMSPVIGNFKNWVPLSDDESKRIEGASNFYHYEILVKEGDYIYSPERITENDIYSITGTTGKPKGIRYMHRNILLGSLQLFHHLALHKKNLETSWRKRSLKER